jgi:hypothetical protein
MIEKLIQAALWTAVALILYGIWLLSPEKFPIMLIGVLTLYIFGMIMEDACSQEEKKRRAVQEKRRPPCTLPN